MSDRAAKKARAAYDEVRDRVFEMRTPLGVVNLSVLATLSLPNGVSAKNLETTVNCKSPLPVAWIGWVKRQTELSSGD